MFHPTALLTLLLLFCTPSLQTFVLYGGRNLTSFAAERGVTTACMQAMNQTLSCDNAFLPRVANIESYPWTTSNLTASCTSTCSSAISSWITNVQTACGTQPFRNEGYLVLAKTIPLMYKRGYDLACLKSSAGGWCWLENQAWQGMDMRRYPKDLCETGNSTWDADICFTPGFDQTAIEPDDIRLRNLYPKTTVCSDCFIKLLNLRLSSPFLAAGADYTTYLLGQYSDLQSYCTTSMALTTASTSLVLGTMTVPTTTAAADTGTSSAAAPSTTCAGQIIPVPAKTQSCHTLSLQYGVTTGDLIILTKDWQCQISSPICAPLSCDTMKIGWGETCESLRKSISTTSNNVTTTQFSTWNWRIVGKCDAVRGDQYICKGPPGGVYTPPPPVYAPTAASSYYSTANHAQPTSTGTIADCGRYHDVASGDTCNSVALRYGITFGDMRTFNTQINTDCTNLWLGYSYCVARVTQPPKSTDGSCGPSSNQAICNGTGFGDCCSYSGYCGSTTAYCGSGNCYSGACTGPQQGITQDGTCGPANHGWLCGDSTWGKCCSTSGYCGNTPAHCDPGNCVSGACNTNPGGPSTDGSCGPNFAGNKTCTGTSFGTCCSNYGYCGSTTDYCSKANCYSGACLST